MFCHAHDDGCFKPTKLKNYTSTKPLFSFLKSSSSNLEPSFSDININYIPQWGIRLTYAHENNLGGNFFLSKEIGFDYLINDSKRFTLADAEKVSLSDTILPTMKTFSRLGLYACLNAKWYFTRNYRKSHQLSILGNAGEYLAFKTGYTYLQGVPTNHVFNISPNIGISRTLYNKWLFDISLGTSFTNRNSFTFNAANVVVFPELNIRVACLL